MQTSERERKLMERHNERSREKEAGVRPRIEVTRTLMSIRRVRLNKAKIDKTVQP
jgi:hypothetical protein